MLSWILVLLIELRDIHGHHTIPTLLLYMLALFIALLLPIDIPYEFAVWAGTTHHQVPLMEILSTTVNCCVAIVDPICAVLRNEVLLFHNPVPTMAVHSFIPIVPVCIYVPPAKT